MQLSVQPGPSALHSRAVEEEVREETERLSWRAVINHNISHQFYFWRDDLSLIFSQMAFSTEIWLVLIASTTDRFGRKSFLLVQHQVILLRVVRWNANDTPPPFIWSCPVDASLWSISAWLSVTIVPFFFKSKSVECHCLTTPQTIKKGSFSVTLEKQEYSNTTEMLCLKSTHISALLKGFNFDNWRQNFYFHSLSFADSFRVPLWLV